MFTGACGFDGSVESQQFDLPGDFLDHQDLVGNILHGGGGLGHCFGTAPGFTSHAFRCFFRLFRVLRVLTDACRHFFHGRGSFLHAGGLIVHTIRYLLCRLAQLAAARGDTA